jgi:hypothetical protein
VKQNSLKKTQKSLLEASRDVGLELNTEKTYYMIVSRHKNVGKNYDLLITNKYFENVANFKCITK